MRGRPPEHIADRIARRSTLMPDGCIVFDGYRINSGYSLVYVDRERGKLLVHRVAYELAYGPIPEGLTIDHTCHNESGCSAGFDCLHRICVNPEHLEAVSQSVNASRSPNSYGSRTHCINGHAFTPENTRDHTRRETGYRYRICRRCDADRAAMYRERKLVVA